MLQAILTGQAQSFILLKAALVAYVYFLPAVLAFLRGHRKFFVILALNLLTAPAQIAVARLLFPGWLDSAATMQHALLVMLCADLGPGWLALLAWSLVAVPLPDPRLTAAQKTKFYDAAAALPLILWFGYGVLQLRPRLVGEAALILSGTAPALMVMQFFALLAAAIFNLLLVWMLVVRDKPVLKSHGLLPRLAAFAGTFLGVGILQLPVAPLGLGMQVVATILFGLGSIGSIVVLARLGKAFSIMPEARSLVTSGPYAHARHPLYTAEMFIIAGTAVQFAQPWAGLIGATVLALLVLRSMFEERVLMEAYPEYAAYRARVKRFLPGII